MGFMDKLVQGALGNMNEISPEELQKEYGAYLMDGENIQVGFRLVRDVVLFTDKRIIIKSGAIGVDINNIYYTDITGVNLRVGLSDRLLHVGDIYISGKGKAQVLWDIENPYPVVNDLQKIVNDIKTDTYFPNDLRPDTNEGFRTKYTGK